MYLNAGVLIEPQETTSVFAFYPKGDPAANEKRRWSEAHSPLSSGGMSDVRFWNKVIITPVSAARKITKVRTERCPAVLEEAQKSNDSSSFATSTTSSAAPTLAPTRLSFSAFPQLLTVPVA